MTFVATNAFPYPAAVGIDHFVKLEEPEGKGQGLGCEYGQRGKNRQEPSGTQDDALNIKQRNIQYRIMKWLDVDVYIE